MLDIYLKRFAYTPMGCFGRLTIPAASFSCFTVERPWADNQPYLSCIPEGTYSLKKRQSKVVKRSTGGAFTEGFEVTQVPDRTYIMLHPANTMQDLEGCIGLGDALGWVSGLWAVTNSRNTFARFMKLTAQAEAWTLHITPTRQIIGDIADG